MSSLITKLNKSGSSGTQKVRATKGKKAASKKPQRSATTATKAKKAPVPKAKKQVSSSKKAAVNSKKKPLKKVEPVKGSKKTPAAQLTSKKRPPAAGKSAAKSATQHTRRVSVPGALAAVNAFENALKLFNRHDYAGARSAFESILRAFSDQPEIVAGARTYLAICHQRLAHAPSVPRNPEALYDQGVIQFNKGKTREAVELYEKALRAEPRAAHIWYSLAAAHARLADTAKALDALRRAISIRSIHRSHARRDLDFVSLRNNPDFQQLTGYDVDYLDE